MAIDSNLQFIRERIYEIRSALIYNMSNSVLKLPTSIVTALNVDDQGQIWFLLNHPSRHFCEYEKEFPARLQFYRKGKPFYLQVSGESSIVNDDYIINYLVAVKEEIRTMAMCHLVLVKMKIENVEYYEQIAQPLHNPVKNFIKQIYSWLFEPTPSMYGTLSMHSKAA